VPVATVVLTYTKIDLKIRAAKLRGVRSEGMICSLAEVGWQKNRLVFIFLSKRISYADARPLLGLEDVILDLTATANRADALSMVWHGSSSTNWGNLDSQNQSKSLFQLGK